MGLQPLWRAENRKKELHIGYNPLVRGAQSKISSRQITTGYTNASGGIIAQGTPVSVDSMGHIFPIDPSNETSVDALVGLTSVAVPNGANGPVTDCGRLENVTTGFSVGSPLYVSKSGTLQIIKPDYGVTGFTIGDFVIFVGVVVQNEFNPSNKDIKLMLTVIGQL